VSGQQAHRRSIPGAGLGERVPLTLVLRDAAGRRSELAVSAEVRIRSPQDDERRPHAH